MSIKPIKINRDIPYADNIANAINEYWRTQVAIPDGSKSAYEGNVFMPSVNGIPTKVYENRRTTHPAIIRVRKSNGKWFITDQEK